MRVVRMRGELLDAIKTEASAGYPDEVCGFLVSRSDSADGKERSVASVEVAPNEFSGERRRRFVISPEELRSAERRASARGEVVTGFYHSHPDHPAIPSAFDTEHAWPWYTYVVVSVERSGVRDVAAFELDPEGAGFSPSSLVVEPSSREAGGR